MTKIQEYLLKLVCEIDEICTEHGIDYVLFGGSSLGIERNEGFLPWDDDLDLLMTKDNYLRFVDVMQTEPRKDRILESPETNPEFPLHFGKYMSLDSSGLIRSLAYGNAHAGIWIDIFYLCPLANEPEEASSMLSWFQAYCEYQNCRFAEVPVYTEGLLEKYKAALEMEEAVGREKTLEWLKHKYDYLADEDCDRYFLHHALTSSVKVYSKRHMQAIVRRNFEGVMLPFSATNRELCREAYGDSWMMIPDIIHQETHDAILDTDKPYTLYQKDFMVLLDKNTVDQDLLEYKQTELFNRQKRYSANRPVAALHAVIDETELKQNLSEDLIRTHYKEQDWSALKEAFRPYNEVLSNPLYEMYDVLPKLTPELDIIYLETILRTVGAWAYAEKLLPLLDIAKGNCKRLLDMIEICRKISIARYDFCNPEAVLNLIRIWDETFGGRCFEVDMARLYVCCERHDVSGLDALLKEFDGYYENPGELLLAKALTEKSAGNLAEYDRTIKEFMSTCRNGVLLLDVRKGRYEF